MIKNPQKLPIDERRKGRKFDPLLSAIGEVFRLQMAIHRLTATEIGKKAKLTYQYVSRLANGDQLSEAKFIMVLRAMPIVPRLEIIKQICIDPIAGIEDLPPTRSDIQEYKMWLRQLEAQLDKLDAERGD